LADAARPCRRGDQIDAARERLETELKGLVDPKLTHAQLRELPAAVVMTAAETRAAAQHIVERLGRLRTRCQRQANSFVTPMGDEMFYRYQQALIDDATTTVGALLQRSQAVESNETVRHPVPVHLAG